MLKLSLKPGEYINIGNDIRIVFSGGSSNNIHLLIDAPRELDIERKKSTSPNRYYTEKGISQEAHQQILEILRRERKKSS